MISKANHARLLDKRTVQSNIKLGFIQEADLKKHLAELPDETGNFDEVQLEDDSISDIDEEILDEDLLDEDAPESSGNPDL